MTFVDVPLRCASVYVRRELEGHLRMHVGKTACKAQAAQHPDANIKPLHLSIGLRVTCNQGYCSCYYLNRVFAENLVELGFW